MPRDYSCFSSRAWNTTRIRNRLQGRHLPCLKGVGECVVPVAGEGFYPCFGEFVGEWRFNREWDVLRRPACVGRLVNGERHCRGGSGPRRGAYGSHCPARCCWRGGGAGGRGVGGSGAGCENKDDCRTGHRCCEAAISMSCRNWVHHFPNPRGGVLRVCLKVAQITKTVQGFPQARCLGRESAKLAQTLRQTLRQNTPAHSPSVRVRRSVRLRAPTPPPGSRPTPVRGRSAGRADYRGPGARVKFCSRAATRQKEPPRDRKSRPETKRTAGYLRCKGPMYFEAGRHHPLCHPGVDGTRGQP